MNKKKRRRPEAESSGEKRRRPVGGERSKRRPSNDSKKRRSGSDAKKWDDGANAGGGNNDYVKIKPGVNYFKLATDDYEMGYSHWIETSDGNKKKINCAAGATREDRQNAVKKCKICRLEASGEAMQTSLNYYFAVLSGNGKKSPSGKRVLTFKPEVGILQCGPMVGKQICTLAKEIIEDVDGEWGEQEIKSISDIALKITRTGEKLNTKYDVRPAISKTIIKGDIGELPDLQKQVKPPSTKEINDIYDDFDGGEEPEEEDWDEEDDSDDELPKRNKNKSTSGKKRRRQEPEEEFDDEDEDEDEEEFDDEDEDEDEFEELEFEEEEWDDED